VVRELGRLWLVALVDSTAVVQAAPRLVTKTALVAAAHPTCGKVRLRLETGWSSLAEAAATVTEAPEAPGDLGARRLGEAAPMEQRALVPHPLAVEAGRQASAAPAALARQPAEVPERPAGLAVVDPAASAVVVLPAVAEAAAITAAAAVAGGASVPLAAAAARRSRPVVQRASRTRRAIAAGTGRS
jgi:hypothetical protein